MSYIKHKYINFMGSNNVFKNIRLHACVFS